MIPFWIIGLVLAVVICACFLAWRSRRAWHQHKWALVHRNAIGQFEKQAGYEGVNIVTCGGRVEKCSCRKMRIVPTVPGYRPVEVTREQVDI